jgi:hypothetical protein
LAVIAYVPAALGTVDEPEYSTLLTVPATEPLTLADCADPFAVTGELVTDNVGVAFAITKFPAEAFVRLL